MFSVGAVVISTTLVVGVEPVIVKPVVASLTVTESDAPTSSPVSANFFLAPKLTSTAAPSAGIDPPAKTRLVPVTVKPDVTEEPPTLTAISPLKSSLGRVNVSRAVKSAVTARVSAGAVAKVTVLVPERVKVLAACATPSTLIVNPAALFVCAVVGKVNATVLPSPVPNASAVTAASPVPTLWSVTAAANTPVMVDSTGVFVCVYQRLRLELLSLQHESMKGCFRIGESLKQKNMT